jgi:hypothetical protein
LTTRLQAGLRGQTNKPAGPPTAQQAQQQEQTERLLQNITEAMPYLNEASDAFAEAGSALQRDEPGPANREQLRAIVALQKARERFLDLRGLIELVHGMESQIQAMLSGDSDPSSPVVSADSITAAKQMQSENLQRSERLASLLEEEKRRSAGQNEATSATGADPANQEARAQQMAAAEKLLSEAQSEMAAAGNLLTRLTDTPESQNVQDSPPDNEAAPEPTGEGQAEPETEPPPSLEKARAHVDHAMDRLQALRRLFYSVVEHLRETAERQSQLNDETQEQATLNNADHPPTTGPLTARQRELQNLSQQIAKALLEQSQQAPAQATGQDQQQMTEALSQAGNLVNAGAAEMSQAVDSMNQNNPSWEPVREHQDLALEKLSAALALLAPPRQQPQDQQQPNQGEQGEDQQQQNQPQQAGADPSRLLQAVRDREAARRKNKSRRPAGYEPVEKDW